MPPMPAILSKARLTIIHLGVLTLAFTRNAFGPASAPFHDGHTTSSITLQGPSTCPMQICLHADVSQPPPPPLCSALQYFDNTSAIEAALAMKVKFRTAHACK